MIVAYVIPAPHRFGRSESRAPAANGRRRMLIVANGTAHQAEFSRGAAGEAGTVEMIERLVAEAEDKEVDVPLLGETRNRYIAVRHGQSEANLDGIISSNVEVGRRTHGLTALGRKQSRICATSLLDIIGRDNLERVVLYSSPYKRAMETAEEAAAALCNTIKFENSAEGKTDYECPPVLVEEMLRERWFGELDSKIITSYNFVWPVDLKDSHHNLFGCESVNQVCSRARELFEQFEERHDDQIILLFGHADVLQIVQTYYARADPRTFSQFRFRNGEVRELLADPNSLPPPVPLTYQ